MGVQGLGIGVRVGWIGKSWHHRHRIDSRFQMQNARHSGISMGHTPAGVCPDYPNNVSLYPAIESQKKNRCPATLVERTLHDANIAGRS